MTADTPPRRPRPLRTVAGFLLALVLFDLLILVNRDTWERHSPDEYAERVAGCARQPRDLVFVGGSPVAEGINPDVIAGIKRHGIPLGDVYAVGLSGGTTSDIYFGTRHACPTPPKVLVYGMTASDINDSRHEPHGPHSLMTWDDVCDWRQTRPDAAEWVTRHYLKEKAGDVWAAYRFRHGIRMWAAERADSIAPGYCPDTLDEAHRQRELSDRLRGGNGYAPTRWFAHRQYDQMKAGGWEQPPFEYLARYKTGSHLRYLHRLIDWAGQGGTELILIDMPVTADLEHRHPAEFAEFRERLAEVERDHKVLVLRATRPATGLNDSHFADLIHLNLGGCERLSHWVRAELERHWRCPRTDLSGGGP
jgi:hypothetical protein